MFAVHVIPTLVLLWLLLRLRALLGTHTVALPSYPSATTDNHSNYFLHTFVIKFMKELLNLRYACIDCKWEEKIGLCLEKRPRTPWEESERN